MNDRVASGIARGNRRKRSARPANPKGSTTAARSPSLSRWKPPPNELRALAVVALAALAALAALVVLSNDPTKYEQESSFAIRPSSTVSPGAVPDVVGTLSDPDNAVTETIVDILGSARLRDSAARTAGISPDSVAASGAEYSWLASRRLGSTIVDLRITGPNRATVEALGAAASQEAPSLVESNYSVYRLESLNAPTSADRVGSKTAQTVALAFLLGALIGIGLLFAERRLRSSVGGTTPDRGSDALRNADGDLTGKTDRLESTLRESLGTGASVRRVAPGRIEVAPPDSAAEGETARRKR
jgi:hypothetical protein